MEMITNQSPIALIIEGVIVALIIAFAIIRLIFSKKNKNKAKEFLEGMSDTVTETLLSIVKSIDPSDFPTVEEFESLVISKVYDSILVYIKDEVDKAYNNKLISDRVFELITSNQIEKFIDSIIENEGISDVILQIYVAEKIKNSDVAEQDRELEKEFSDEEKFYEESSSEDLVPAENIEPTEEEVAELNPPKEEEDYMIDPEDTSVEVIDEEKPQIIINKDKNGNNLYYEIDSEGRKKRVSKSYAESILNN